ERNAIPTLFPYTTLFRSEDPRGPIKLDDYGNPTENVYVLKVERVGGRLVNTVVHTYPMVSQFWTYGAADFLRMPLYTRDYPPVRSEEHTSELQSLRHLVC